MNNKNTRRAAGLLVASSLCCALSAVAMDRVRVQIGSDLTQTTYGVSGAGITLVILDRGIDYFHPDFRHPDGTTRIKWLLDMSGQTSYCSAGRPPSVEYSEAQINAALDNTGPFVNSIDRVGHGTVTAGIATGNGRAFATGKYRGIAPDADLVIVKYTSEGALAHDNEPAESPFIGCWTEALDWVEQKITALDQPTVALGNFGSQWGPMDGSSIFSREIDEHFPEDMPGRIWVEGAGDEGVLDSHAGGQYNPTTDTLIPFTITQNGFYQASLWYDSSAPAQISVSLDNGTLAGPVVQGGTASQNGVRIFHYVPGFEPEPWTSTSGDGAVYLDINGYVGSGDIIIRSTNGQSGQFDAYIPLTDRMRFTDLLVPGRLADIAATSSAIILGAYVNKTTYTDLDGIQRVLNTEGDVDELWIGSAAGPTRDGRRGVDVMLPGHNVFASYGVNSYFGSFRFNQINDGGGFYGRQGAVSGAAPILLGAVALLLEMDPTLTTAQVRQIIHDTAITDAQTGATPNTQWGFGKLDLFAAAQIVALNSGMDADQDTVANNADNCVMTANPDQRDTDADGLGNVCDADLNQDCVVNAIDLGLFRAAFFTADANADFDGNGVVNVADLGRLRLAFFTNYTNDNPSGVANLCAPAQH